MVLLLSYKWFRSLPSLVRFSRIPNEIVIIKQMNAVCWRIIIDVPFPLLDNEGGGQRPRVSWCITVAILIINTIMLSSGTRPLPLDSESFTIITRFDGISPNTRRAITSYVNARLDECLFNLVCLGASSNVIVAKIGSGYSLRVREGLRSRSVWRTLLFGLANYCFLRGLSRMLLLFPRNGVDVVLIATICNANCRGDTSLEIRFLERTWFRFFVVFEEWSITSSISYFYLRNLMMKFA